MLSRLMASSGDEPPFVEKLTLRLNDINHYTPARLGRADVLVPVTGPGICMNITSSFNMPHDNRNFLRVQNLFAQPLLFSASQNNKRPDLFVRRAYNKKPGLLCFFNHGSQSASYSPSDGSPNVYTWKKRCAGDHKPKLAMAESVKKP